MHRSAQCVSLAIRRKALPRALRVTELDTADLLEWVGTQGW